MSTAQRNKTYQVLDAHTILVCLALHMRFSDNQKNKENKEKCQSYSFTVYSSWIMNHSRESREPRSLLNCQGNSRNNNNSAVNSWSVCHWTVWAQQEANILSFSVLFFLKDEVYGIPAFFMSPFLSWAVNCTLTRYWNHCGPHSVTATSCIFCYWRKRKSIFFKLS